MRNRIVPQFKHLYKNEYISIQIYPRKFEKLLNIKVINGIIDSINRFDGAQQGDINIVPINEKDVTIIATFIKTSHSGEIKKIKEKLKLKQVDVKDVQVKSKL